MVKIASVTALLLGACAAAFAVDGQVLINQSTVMAAGGFPYAITQPGSYKLSGNLTPPVNVSAISISARGVTLDLNGFGIYCSVAGVNFSCVDSSLAQQDTVLRNGSVVVSGSQFFRTFGVTMNGRSTIENLRIQVPGPNSGITDSSTALFVPAYSTVRGNTFTAEVTASLPYQQIIIHCPSVVVENVNSTGAPPYTTGEGCAFANNVNMQ
jgi:hypothetical protein